MTSRFVPARFYATAPDLPTAEQPVVIRRATIRRQLHGAHVHDGVEIGAVLSGTPTLYWASHRIALCPGDCYCTSGLIPHMTGTGHGRSHELAYAVVSAEAMLGLTPSRIGRELLERVRVGWGREPGVIRGRPDIAERLAHAAGESQNAQGPYVAAVRWALALPILIACARALETLRGTTSAEPVGASRASDEIVLSACTFIQQHWNESIPVTTIARTCGASRSHFTRAFTAAIGRSPIEYRNLIRVQHAIEGISSGKRSIDTIAGDCGFHSVANFNRIFRAMTGRLPRSYRVG